MLCSGDGLVFLFMRVFSVSVPVCISLSSYTPAAAVLCSYELGNDSYPTPTQAVRG